MAKKKSGLQKESKKSNLDYMVDINGVKLPSHVSYSSLSTWIDCGWKYYLSRVAQVPEPPTWYFIGGSALHTATELYDKQSLGVSIEDIK